MGEGLLVAAAGMGIVFASLGALLLVMLLLGRLFASKEGEQEESE